MNESFANGTHVAWISNRDRERRGTVVTTMKTHYPPAVLLRLTDALPGEVGECRVVPVGKLVVVR